MRRPPEEPVEGGIELREVIGGPGRELGGIRGPGEGADRCCEQGIVHRALRAHDRTGKAELGGLGLCALRPLDIESHA